MTVIYFAGGEVEALSKALLENGVRRVLYSYYYIQQMGREGAIERLQEMNPHVEWFLDSGAFTYWMKARDQPEKLMPVHEYKRRYFDYIAATGERWSRIAELDLENTFEDVTLDTVDEWREEMLDRWPHLPIMPVWHSVRGPEEWTSYCRDERIRYIAIGSGLSMASPSASYEAKNHQRLKDEENRTFWDWETERVKVGGVVGLQSTGLIRRMVNEAHQWNKIVHGFGMTRVNTALKLIPFDSVDSTSWLMAQKFGTIFVFQANKFILLGKDGLMKKDRRKMFRKHFERIGVDWEKVESDDVSECRKASILAWRRLSDRLEYIRSLEGRSLYEEHEGTLTDLNESYPHDAPKPRESGDTATAKAIPRFNEFFRTPLAREDEPEVKPKARDENDEKTGPVGGMPRDAGEGGP